MLNRATVAQPGQEGRHRRNPELPPPLGLAALLVWLGHHTRIRPHGLFALYVAGYSIFRVFIETLRVDPAKELFGLRLNFCVMGFVFLAASAWFVHTQRSGGSRRTEPAHA